MVSESTVLRDKGVLTLPVSLRRKYNLRAGDTFSVIDLGEGAIVLARRASRIDELGDRVAQMVQEAGYTPEQLMATLDEERETVLRGTLRGSRVTWPGPCYSLIRRAVCRCSVGRGCGTGASAAEPRAPGATDRIGTGDRGNGAQSGAQGALALPYYRLALKEAQLRIVKDPSATDVQRAGDLVGHPPDIPILLAAMHSRVDYLVTLNRRHFIDDPLVARRAGLLIGTPGDALSHGCGAADSRFVSN